MRARGEVVSLPPGRTASEAGAGLLGREPHLDTERSETGANGAGGEPGPRARGTMGKDCCGRGSGRGVRGEAGAGLLVREPHPGTEGRWNWRPGARSLPGRKPPPGGRRSEAGAGLLGREPPAGQNGGRRAGP